MSGCKFSSYPGYGRKLFEEMGYHQAVRVGDRIETSGQGGWCCETGKMPTDLNDEIDGAFVNIDRTLKDAGGKGWSQVYKINIFATDEAMTEAGMGRMVENMKKWMPDHSPILTGVGVNKLGQPGMRIEVEVVAHCPPE